MYNGGFRSNKRTPDGVGTVAAQAVLVQAADPQPTITSWSIQGSDDRALNPAGGQTVVVKGNGFTTGMTVSVGVTAIGSVTIVSSTQATFTSPAKTAGNYTLTMANANGQAAILVPGLAYSTIVTWTTPAGSIGTTYETAAFTESVVATSDSSITYTLASGSLPTGATLNANGVITGTAAVTGSPTTYSFSVTATDAELQDSTQSFTITVAPDAVTWVSPANNTSYSLTGNQPMSNVTLSATAASGSGITYSANALPTGVSLTGNVIYGTPTVAQTVSTLLTATANTTTRSSTETISWTVSLGDIYWPYVSMLLNGSTPTTTFINDASLNNNMLTIVGDTKPNLFNPYAGGYYSNYFNGSTDYLSWLGTTVGTQAFTIEFWVYATGLSGSSGNQAILGTPNQNGLGVFLVNNTTISVDKMLVGGTNYAATLQNNTWYHIAVVRNASNVETVFINGVRSTTGTATDANNYSAATTQIGYTSSGFPQRYAGYISNLRVVVGSALYDPTQSTITVPTSPLTAVANTSLLTCQAPRFIDNSTNAYALTVSGTPQISSAVPFVASNTYATYGSAYFDGSGDWITMPYNPALTMGASDFTIETWVYPLAFNTNNYVLMQDDGTNAGQNFQLRYNNSGNIEYIFWSSGSNRATNVTITSSTAMTKNAWNHVSMTYTASNTTTRMFLNGVLVGSSTTAPWNGASYTNQTVLGNYNNGSTNQTSGNATLNAYVVDVRMIKGTAIYTSNFTPPTSPLTTVANTQLLTCQYNGGANNNGFVDQSSFNNIITRNGNTTQGTFSPYSQTGWSNYFNGSSYLSTNQAAGAFGTGSFTIEFWWNSGGASQGGGSTYPRIVSNGVTLPSTNGAWGVQTANAGANTLLFSYYNGSYTIAASASINLNDGVWHHVACTRSGTTINLYADGVLQATGSLPSAFSLGVSSEPVLIGYQPRDASYINGYVSNLRIVSGSVLYTSTFTPSTTPLTAVTNTSLLTCQSPRFVDNSPNNYALTASGSPSTQAYSPFGGVTSVPTSYSNYFDGTGDYLNIPSSTVLALASSDFTIECWFNTTAKTNSYPVVLSNGNFGAGKWQLDDRHATASSTKLIFGVYGASTSPNWLVSTTSIQNNTWYHVAIVRSGSTFTMYINGTSEATQTYAGAVDAGTAQTVYVGQDAGQAGTNYNGNVSNLRIVKGQALYTTNFTPSTTPLTTTSQGATASNVSLLTCQSNTIIDNSPNYFAITAAGDTKPLPFNPFGMTNTSAVSYTPAGNGGSMYFDGTGDYLTTPSSTYFNLGSNNFTAECWFYPTVTPGSNASFFSKRTDNATYGGFILYINTSLALCCVVNLTAGAWDVSITGSASMKVGAWNHAALTRNSNTWTLWLNGVSVGTQTVSGTIPSNSNALAIGAGDAAGQTVVTSGYISDARITNGVSLYTANFYPGSAPATPTVTIGATTYASSLLLNGTSGGIIDWHSTNDFETVGNTQLAPQDPYAGSFYSYGFDGTTNSIISLPSVTSIANIGTGDFTVEAWVYLNATGSAMDVLSKFFSTGTTLFYNGTNFVWYNTNATTALAGTVSAGKWYHVAAVRSSGSLTVYLNGVPGNTISYTTSLPGGSAPFIGTYNNVIEFLNGYISNLRATNTAVYTSTFTPPTSPLTAISGTLLLTCQSNKFIDNSTNALTLTSGSTSAVKSINPFQQNTGKSLYFDGTGDYILAASSAANPNYTLGTGDFTIESWVFLNSFSSGGEIIDFRPTSTNGLYPALYVETTGVLYYYVSSANQITGATLTTGQWYYIALARSSGVTKLFVNGTQSGSSYNDTNNYIVGASRPVIGTNGFTLGNYPLNGYLKDLRITKGVARYTTTFTPPTSPDQTN